MIKCSFKTLSSRSLTRRLVCFTAFLKGFQYFQFDFHLIPEGEKTLEMIALSVNFKRSSGFDLE